MSVLFTILWAALWSYVCYKMADSRGRNTTTGAILGFIFGIFAVIGYAIAGNKETEA